MSALQLPVHVEQSYPQRDGEYDIVDDTGATLVWRTSKEAADALVRACNVRPTLVKALEGLLDHYVQLVNSGDAGNWDPEKEPVVIAARHALRLARGEE